jgi:PEP-CTERM motif
MKNIFKIVSGVFALGLAATEGNAATTYVGNGNTSFGGGVGNGNIIIDDTISGTLTITTNVTVGDNALVIYFDSKGGGFNTTAGFADANDSLRKAISGYGGAVNERSTTLLPFAADFAIGVDKGWGGLWELANGGNNSLIYKTTALDGGFGVGGVGTGKVLTINVADLGLTANSGQSFNFFAMMVSGTGYTSSEFIGASSISGNLGYGNTQTVGTGSSYTLVPEPSTGMLMGLGVAGLLVVRRFRKSA